MLTRAAHLARPTIFSLIACIVVASLSRPALAQPSGQPPSDATIWWTWDPRAVAASPVRPAPPDRLAGAIESRVAAALMRAAASSGIITDPAASDAFRVVLAASELLALPHSVCVYTLEDSADAPHARGDQAAIRVEAVIDLLADSTDVHRRLLRTIESILVPPPGSDPGTQRPFTLASGINAVAYSRPDWPTHAEVSWASTPGHFLIGIGPGVLDRWLSRDRSLPPPSPAASATHSPAPRPDIDAQRAFLRSAHPDTQALFHFELDVTRLRAGLVTDSHAAPDGTGDGRVARLLRAWQLLNARSFMLRASVIPPPLVRTSITLEDFADPREPKQTYFGPPLVVLDATWSARSESPTDIAHAALSEPYWPAAELAFTPPRPLKPSAAANAPPQPEPAHAPRAAFALVFRTDASRTIDTLAGFYAGLLDRPSSLPFDRDLRSWRRSTSSIRERQSRRLGPLTVVLGPGHDAPLVFNELAIITPLDSRADPGSFDRDLSSLLAPLRDHIRSDPDSLTRALAAPNLGVIDLAAWQTLPRQPGRPAAFIATLGIGAPEIGLRDRIRELARWLRPSEK